MDETIIGGSGARAAEPPSYFSLLGGTGKCWIRQPGEFVSAGRNDGNHLVFPYNQEVSSVHALLWYGALEGRPKRALYAVDLSRNGIFLPTQDVAIKDVPRWRGDAKALRAQAEQALDAVRSSRKGVPASAPPFVPADHASFPESMQLEYKESALIRVIEKLGGTVGVACLDDLAAPGKEIQFLRMVRDPTNADVVRIEPGVLRLKERAAAR